MSLSALERMCLGLLGAEACDLHYRSFKLRDMIAEVDLDNNKTVEFSEFLVMMKKGLSEICLLHDIPVRASGGKVSGGFATLTSRVAKLNKVGGTSTASAADTTHTYSDVCFSIPAVD